MATIANLTKKDGSFTGTLILPFLDGKKITLDPVEKKGKGPEFRVSVGGFEAGAAWKRTSKAGNAYVSVKLNDPSFHDGTIHPVLVKGEGGYVLVWKPRAALPVVRAPVARALARAEETHNASTDELNQF